MVHCCNYQETNLKDERNFWLRKEKWGRAGTNTSVCLLGCSIGDFGAIICFAAFWPGEFSIWFQMAVATAAGITTSIILETIILQVREKFAFKDAVKVAAGMSLISMIVMEMAMNFVDFGVTMSYGLVITDVLYWLMFIPALIAGWLAALPYNYWRLVKHNKACH